MSRTIKSLRPQLDPASSVFPSDGNAKTQLSDITHFESNITGRDEERGRCRSVVFSNNYRPATIFQLYVTNETEP